MSSVIDSTSRRALDERTAWLLSQTPEPSDANQVDAPAHETPMAHAVNVAPLPPIPRPPRPPPRRAQPTVRIPRAQKRSALPWIASGLALGVLAVLGALVAKRVVDARPYARTHVTYVETTHAARASAAAPPPRGADGIPTVQLDALPVVPSTHGTLVFSPSQRGHRVYVDGSLAGDSDAPLRVRCGLHAVRVGSRGEERTVDVPCGGQIDVR